MLTVVFIDREANSRRDYPLPLGVWEARCSQSLASAMGATPEAAQQALNAVLEAFQAPADLTAFDYVADPLRPFREITLLFDSAYGEWLALVDRPLPIYVVETTPERAMLKALSRLAASRLDHYAPDHRPYQAWNDCALNRWPADMRAVSTGSHPLYGLAVNVHQIPCYSDDDPFRWPADMSAHLWQAYQDGVDAELARWLQA